MAGALCEIVPRNWKTNFQTKLSAEIISAGFLCICQRSSLFKAIKRNVTHFLFTSNSKCEIWKILKVGPIPTFSVNAGLETSLESVIIINTPISRFHIKL